jgi:hypothetical protein
MAHGMPMIELMSTAAAETRSESQSIGQKSAAENGIASISSQFFSNRNWHLTGFFR